jgi:hypothetical protein
MLIVLPERGVILPNHLDEFVGSSASNTNNTSEDDYSTISWMPKIG